MVRLFQAEDRLFDTYWCFASDADIAKKIITKELLNGKRRLLKMSDVTEQYIKEDGVKYLIDHDFVGIPQRSIFMLNGCMSSMEEHYTKQGKSGTLWWSEKIPGSKELWA
jgi:hypothetical protein